MKNTMKLFALCVLLMTVAAGGCDDDSGSGGLGDDNVGGVSNSTAISDLTAEQAADVCMALSDYFAGLDVSGLACTGYALAQAFQTQGGVSECEMFRTECLNDPDALMSAEDEADLEVDPDQCTMDATNVPPECDANVGAVSACAEAIEAAINEVANQISCDLLDDPESLENIDELFDFSTPTECQPLIQCGLIEEDEQNG